MSTRPRIVRSALCLAAVAALLGSALAPSVSASRLAPRLAVPPGPAETAAPSAAALAFEPNVGQADARARFVARGHGLAVFVTDRETVLALSPANGGPSASLFLRCAGGSACGTVEGERRLRGHANYLTGADPSRWRADVPTFAAVRRRDVYSGVDVVTYGASGGIEYDFVVAPGADPRSIALEVDGAERLRLDGDGNLAIAASDRTIRQRRPSAYQDDGRGGRRPVPCAYRLDDARRVRLDVGAYDATRPLVVDPVVVTSTYLGGSLASPDLHPYDNASEVAVDATGAAYVVGYTTAVDFPTTPGAFATTTDGGDAFVTKLDATGALVYSTYLGGSGFESPGGVAVDASGAAYVAGATNSTDFPVTPGAFDTLNEASAIFLAKLDPSGASLAYATYLQGPSAGGASAADVAVDAAGAAYVTGTALGDYLTTPGAFDTVNEGTLGDAFVTKVSPTGASVVYSTFLGGAGGERGEGVDVDAAGSAYVTGSSNGGDFPVTPGAFDTTPSPGPNAFVAKLDPAGAALAYATYLAGDEGIFYGSAGSAVRVDSSGAAVVAGSTDAADFPTTAGASDTTENGGADAFVTKLAPSGAAVVYSTFLGGPSDDFAADVALDGAGGAVVAGRTEGPGFPATPGAFATYAGEIDGFVARFDAPGSSLVYADLFGGADDDAFAAVAANTDGGAVAVGSTFSSGYPTTPNAFDSTFNGSIDGAVTRVAANGSSLVYSTFLGGIHVQAETRGTSVSVDASGAIYVAGSTTSIDLPAAPGALGSTNAGLIDAFVTKLDSAGAAVVYTTYLGGASVEDNVRVAVDATGAAYVLGMTLSADFPTTPGAFDRSLGDAVYGSLFVAKLGPSGSTLAYATYLGSDDVSSELIGGIGVDAAGEAIVAGYTDGDFPTTPGAFDTAPNFGNYDAFVTKLKANGTGLVYSTYVGGSDHEECSGLAVDASGEAVVAGTTYSHDFPLTPGALDATPDDLGDVFVSRLAPDGASLVSSTLLGGASNEFVAGVAVDAAGAAVVAGTTRSADFPTTDGTRHGPRRGLPEQFFVAKLSTDATTLDYALVYGASLGDRAHGVAVDETGAAWVVGVTGSDDFPTTPDAFQPDYHGAGDGVVTRVAPDGSAIVYSTYLGGSVGDSPEAVAAGPLGVTVVGTTSSADFPLVAPYQSAFRGALDAFVTTFCADAGPLALACPPNVAVEGGTVNGGIGAAVAYTTPAAVENCALVAAVCSPASGSVFPEGTTTVTCTATSGTATASCSFTVTVATTFGACAVDDATGDSFREVVDARSPAYGVWEYRVARTGERLGGSASSIHYIAGRSLTSSDTDDPHVSMSASLSYGSNTGTVTVLDRATGRRFVLRDRSLSNSTCP